MSAILKRLGLAFLKSLAINDGEFGKKMIKSVLVILLGLLGFSLFFLIAIPTVFLHIPAVKTNQISVFYETIETINEDWQEECNIEIPWEEIVAVYGVLHDQDYSGVKQAHIRNLAEEWIETIEEENSEGEIEIIYNLKRFSEVLDELGFDDTQKDMAKSFKMCLEETPIVPAGWIANPVLGWSWPVPGYDRAVNISSGYGYRLDPFTKLPSYHSGIDIAAPKGKRVIAAHRGTVEKVGSNNTYGKYVITDSGLYRCTYAHLSRINIAKGEFVEAGDLIGRVGNTGRSTGPHLHFEVKYLDSLQNPLNFY